MIQLAMSSRDRKTLAAGASAVLVLFAIARGVPALREWQDTQRSAAESAVEQLVTARGGLKVLPALRDTLRARMTRVSALDSILVTGTSVPGAAAALAATLEDVAAEDGLAIAALQIRPDTLIVRSLALVAVRVTGTTDIKGLAAFLRDVEGSDRTLVVRELSVSQPEPVAPESKAEALRVEILIEAIALIHAPERA